MSVFQRVGELIRIYLKRYRSLTEPLKYSSHTTEAGFHYHIIYHVATITMCQLPQFLIVIVLCINIIAVIDPLCDQIYWVYKRISEYSTTGCLLANLASVFDPTGRLQITGHTRQHREAALVSGFFGIGLYQTLSLVAVRVISQQKSTYAFKLFWLDCYDKLPDIVSMFKLIIVKIHLSPSDILMILHILSLLILLYGAFYEILSQFSSSKFNREKINKCFFFMSA